jgi:hypothetical protein
MLEKETAWDELKILHDSSMKIWQMYLTWFTWSLGANLLAMSYIVTREKVNADLVVGLGLIMIATLGLAIAGGLKMKLHYAAIDDRARALAPALGTDAYAVSLIFGSGIARYVCRAIPLTFLFVMIGWMAMVWKYGH